ncbi:hypothetical protein BDQ17DRAFT_1345990 [Cyathus striatus]|nr:hypothetical protein BDQ17DRAFT_1345990 [Cyathus striatus]
MVRSYFCAFIGAPSPFTVPLFFFLFSSPSLLVVPPSGTGGGREVMAPTLCTDVTASRMADAELCAADATTGDLRRGTDTLAEAEPRKKKKEKKFCCKWGAVKRSADITGEVGAGVWYRDQWQ